ncbi:MAG: amino acid ABC transporter permease [Streptococcaceae bacterium]|jgi:polar amino acid transport system permease protein|nr:amino acid ABC transporter permease [Streptococcaceae bacterium]
MDINFIKEFFPKYIDASILVLRLGILGIIISILVGFFLSVIIYYKIPCLQRLAAFLVELSRNSPLLVILFFLYFGLTKVGVKITSEAAAIIGLSFLGSGYMAETFRAGLDSVSKTQIEGGLAIGLTKNQVMRYIILPECFSNSIPPLCSNIIFLLKETSVFSAVALADLVFVAKDLIGIYYKTDEALLMLVICYFIILLPILILAFVLEKRLRRAKFGN